MTLEQRLNLPVVRRRAFVGAAWAAPVIVAVGAAPAMAATGPADIVVTIERLVRSGAGFSTLLTLTNLNTEPTSGLSVTLGFEPLPEDTLSSYALTDGGGPQGGWVNPVRSPGSARRGNLTYLSMGEIPGNGFKTLEAGGTLQLDIGPGTLFITGSTVGGTFRSTQADFA